MSAYDPGDRVAEIVETSTSRFVAQCTRLDGAPPLGAFVRVGPRATAALEEVDPFAGAALQDGTVYGLVCEVTSSSLEPGRRAAALGLDEGDLEREQPQIHELLCTTFIALVVAHVAGGRLRLHLPDTPPRIHAWVGLVPTDQVCALTDRMDYLRAVLSSPGVPAADDVVAAVVRLGARCHGGGDAFLVSAGKQLAVWLHDDCDRLSAILDKVVPQ